MEYESEEAFWERRLLAVVPEFRSIYEAHVALHDAALSTLLMADLRRFMAEHLARCMDLPRDRDRAEAQRLLQGRRVRRHTTLTREVIESASVVRRTLDCLEECVIDGQEIRLEEAIMVSFLEHLDTIKAPMRHTLVSLMGPHLRSDLAEVDRYLVEVRERDANCVPMYGLKDRRRFAREARAKKDLRDIPKNWLAEIDR